MPMVPAVPVGFWRRCGSGAHVRPVAIHVGVGAGGVAVLVMKPLAAVTAKGAVFKHAARRRWR